ncbi:efflux RND transporter periplasmic adaptor subunit [Patescibacteria group bacterium]|nr:efflux RND transporter periplasmic adaptor subunit [Patescibacteria group bacterium]
MKSVTTGLRRLLMGILHPLRITWRKYRTLGRRYQWAIGLVLAIIILSFVLFGGQGTAPQLGSYERTVTLSTVSNLSGVGGGGNAIGTVRSVTEAKLLAQTGGTVRRVNVEVGSSVSAGAVLAELENASERAAVLQAEGSYDAAVAANSVSVKDVSTDIRNAYRSNFAELETAFEIQIDSLFADPAPGVPGIISIAGYEKGTELQDTRRTITYRLNDWRRNLATANTARADALLIEMENAVSLSSTFVVQLAQAANRSDSGATATQLANVAAARTTITSMSAEVSGLRNTYEAQQTSVPSGTSSATEAAVKQALGSLRLAQAALEKTVIRAPIAGTVNFLPIRVGDYVTSFTHVATVAQNGALEIVIYMSEDQRAALAVGDRLMIEDGRSGIVTSIAPALDPVTKQIEVHIAVEGATEEDTFVNGQTVRVSIPAIATSPTGEGPLLLPLSAVKLYADSRVVFTVSEEGRLVATPVEIGDVRGERVEILTPLSPDLRIVTDARGLAEGERVKIAP